MHLIMTMLDVESTLDIITSGPQRSPPPRIRVTAVTRPWWVWSLSHSFHENEFHGNSLNIHPSKITLYTTSLFPSPHLSLIHLFLSSPLTDSYPFSLTLPPSSISPTSLHPTLNPHELQVHCVAISISGLLL